MANYKNIVDVESVAEATESMNVLVEDAGSLKKVPAGGMIGGGSGKTLIINYKYSPMPTGLDTLPTQVYTANMTYAEFEEAVMSGEFTGGIFCQFNTTMKEFHYYVLQSIDRYSYPTIIMSFASASYGDITLCFNNDNTITEVSTVE